MAAEEFSAYDRMDVSMAYAARISAKCVRMS